MTINAVVTVAMKAWMTGIAVTKKILQIQVTVLVAENAVNVSAYTRLCMLPVIPQ